MRRVTALRTWFASRPRGEWLTALGVSVAAVAALLLFTDLRTQGTSAYRDPGWDRHLYVEMARSNPFDFHLAPYCWRVLVPAVAWASPLPLQATFLSVAVVSAVGAGAALYLLYRADRFEVPLALAGVLFFVSLGWGTRYQLADFWIPDAAAFFAVAVAMLMAVRRRPVAFAVAVFVGVLAKESVIFVAPLYYTLNAARAWDPRLLRQTLLLVAPAVVALVVLRLAIPAWNNDEAYIATLPPEISRFPELFEDYEYPALFEKIAVDQRWRYRGLDTTLDYTTGTFGLPLLVLAAWGVVRRPGLWLRLAPFLVLVYVQILFATDTERLLVLGAPAMVWLALVGAKDLCERFGVSPLSVLVLAVASFALLLTDRDDFEVALAAQAWLCLAWAAGIAVILAVTRRRTALEASPGG